MQLVEDRKVPDRLEHHSTFEYLNLFYLILERQTFLDLLGELQDGLGAMPEGDVGGWP